ncbi:13777_t:CDS:1 [Gigaspora margarita]|uniref:13777_t:CDS:1 n=1 Tax=Gigaspora margarita TaxID=4874 RepID=A0ABM8VZV0_GIGMA|nr:13777_t:CDS:1 [Gigaspora margarita]
MTGTIEFASGDSFSGLDVLEVSLHQLNFAGEILEDIARKTDINSFSENSWDAKIEGLNDNELPKRARKIDIREAIRKKREELTEKVSEMSKRGQADEKIKTTEVSSSKNTKELKVNTERRKSEALKLDG